jgi:radical SAM family RiPP maturation amino acid epimerase
VSTQHAQLTAPGLLRDVTPGISVMGSNSDGAIRPVFRHPELGDRSYCQQLAETKRLLELIYLDPSRRQELERDPTAFAKALRLTIDPEELRPLWQKGLPAPSRLVDDSHLALAVRRYRAWTLEKLEFRDEIAAMSLTHNPSLAAWRMRQNNRCLSELGPSKDASIVHVPVAFELSTGCSVGCWFCGVGADKLSQHAEYAATRTLWREMLPAIKDVIGDGARWGFCYWATEPLDNPDYEEFCGDFADVFGRFPQTTTAIPLRDAERTRKLLRLSVEEGCELNRFSILSAKILDKLHATFSPEELLRVELLPLNKESGNPKARAGHAMVRRAPSGHAVTEEGRGSTIACVSGFLINLLERRLRLITPCGANDRWPLGYWELDNIAFRDAEHLRREMQRMIDEHMPVRLDADQAVAFRRDVQFLRDEQRAILSSPWTQISLDRPEALAQVAERVARNAGQSAAEIALELEREGAPLSNTIYLLQQLFQWGLFDEEPIRTVSLKGRTTEERAQPAI